MRTKITKRTVSWTGNIRSRDVGEKLRLVPYWEIGLTESDRLSLIIDPGPSFGAGDHPTTVMALEFLETAISGFRSDAPRPTVLDVGTGTGVLAIAAALMGAGLTVGLDIDPAAAFTARRNLVLNGLDGRTGGHETAVELFIGPLDAVGGCFDIVVANLAAPTLLRLLDPLKRAVNGFLILSGIAEAMADQVFHSYESPETPLISRMNRDGWHSGLFGRDEY